MELQKVDRELVSTVSHSPPPDSGPSGQVEILLQTKSADISEQQEEFTLEWSDVTFSVGDKKILHGISGGLARGQLMAIMGGSGAGKSSLLNVLCGRQLTENSCGSQVTVGGRVAMEKQVFNLGDDDNIKYLSAYVMQDDVLTATDTPREAILFSARLRLPATMSDAEKKARVDKLIAELRLPSGTLTENYQFVHEESDAHEADELAAEKHPPEREPLPPSRCACLHGTKCGKYLGLGNTQMRNCSGGEKKRTSVGVELVTEPNLVFLDEPTSGLDSFTALKTLEMLKQLSRDGRQVIATIHQPSAEIFMMLDQLCLLAKGHLAYFGPAAKAVDYFESLGYPLPPFVNPADHIVNLIQQQPDEFIEHWRSRTENGAKINMAGYEPLRPKQREAAGICRQFLELSKRELRIFIRDPRPSRIRFAQTILFSVLIGVLYLQLPHSQQGLRDRFGAVFFLGLNSSMTGLMSAVLTFPEQRVLFERERKNAMYPTWVYVFVKGNMLLLEQTFFVALYLLVAYWMVGMDSTFLELFISVALTVNCAAAVGLLVGTFADDAQQGMLMSTGAFIPLILFANFLVSLEQIPEFIRWIQWIDLFRYALDALSITEFRDTAYHCTSTEYLRPAMFLQQLNISNPAVLAQIQRSPGICPITSGNQYLENLDVDKNDLAFDWYMLAVLFFAFRILGCAVLMKRNGA